MVNLAEISQKISLLFKEAKNQENHQNHKTILELYNIEIKNQYLREDILRNDLLIKNIFNSYKALGKYEDGAAFIINTLKYKFTPTTDNYFLVSFGWNIYFLLKNVTKTDDEMNIESGNFHPHHNVLKIEKEDLIEYLNCLLKLLNPENAKEANLRVRVLFQFVKYEKSNTNPDWHNINNFLNLLDVEKLDTNAQIITIKNGPKAGKQIELASDLENWYSYKTKALLEIEYYNECINESEKALVVLKNYHYDNAVWLKRRIAISKIKLGENKEGLKMLYEVLLHKKEWFVFKEYAEELVKLNEINEALKYAVDAALIKGEILLRLDLFNVISEILLKKNEKELAEKHTLLELAVRVERNWKIPKHLEDLYVQIKDELNNYSSKILLEECRNYWKTFLRQAYVKKILPEKRIGWIRADGTEYFFRFNVFEGSISKLNEGDKVRFMACKGINRVKNLIEDDVIYMTL
ncbi:MAG: hypothetical protein V1773_17495 [bacterium]